MPFCYKGELRPNITQPWTRNRRTNATDGRILVRVPLVGTVPENEAAPNVENVWMEFKPDAAFIPLPELPPPVEQTCPECGGNGISGGCECEECEGGIISETIKVKIGERLLSVRYLRLIAALPNPVVATDGDGMTPMSFKFDGGGEGLLMPMRE